MFNFSKRFYPVDIVRIFDRFRKVLIPGDQVEQNLTKRINIGSVIGLLVAELFR